jgi:hypothetical protein
MSVHQQIVRNAEWISIALATSFVASAQMTAGDGGNPCGSLADDIRPGLTDWGHGAAHAGPVLDGGSVFVDLGGAEPLVLIFEPSPFGGADPRGVRPTRNPPRVRLAGGTPGNAGAILVDLDAPGGPAHRRALGSAVISGVFDLDGSFVVDLPGMAGEVTVQGVEVTPLGGAFSGIRRILPDGQLVDPDAPTWEASAISDAVRRATRNPCESLVRLRFFGAARLAGLQRSADVTVVLGREPATGGHVLALSALLAQRTGLVDPGDDGGARFHFRTAEELSAAVEAVILLDAFADAELELEWARAQLDALRALPGGDVGRCGTLDRAITRRDSGSRAHGGALGDAGVTVVQPVLELSWNLLAGLAAPQGAGDKQPVIGRKDGAGRYTGAIADSGDVVIQLPQDEEVEATLGDAVELDAPQRAGDKQPVIGRKDGAGSYSGAIGDAGERMADLDRSDKTRRAAQSLDSATRTLELLRRRLGPGGHIRR